MTQQIETPAVHNARRGNGFHTFVNANDSSAVVSCGLDGWLEPEV